MFRFQVNHEKTEIFALGNSTLQDVDFRKHNVRVNIKILVVHFGYDVKRRDALNFGQTLKNKNKSINMWFLCIDKNAHIYRDDMIKLGFLKMG